MAYATVADWKLWAADNTTYFTNAEDTSLDDVISDALDAATRQIEQDCGRVFYQTEDEDRTFRVGDDGYVRFVDLVASSIDAVQYDSDNDDTADEDLTDTDYLLGPLTDERGRAPSRYQWMKRRAGASDFPGPGLIVTITADWGYVESDGSPPPDIVKACVLRAGRLFARREAKLGAVSVPNLGTVGMVKGRDIDFEDLIRPYILTARYAVT